jgi:hypothetical protein
VNARVARAVAALELFAPADDADAAALIRMYRHAAELTRDEWSAVLSALTGPAMATAPATVATARAAMADGIPPSHASPQAVATMAKIARAREWRTAPDSAATAPPTTADRVAAFMATRPHATPAVVAAAIWLSGRTARRHVATVRAAMAGAA